MEHNSTANHSRSGAMSSRFDIFFSSVYHPQSNGQVESTNKTVVKILKKKLSKRKGGWVEYLPEVMWSYRTTISSATSETPYSLAFGVEAVIPVEIGSPSFRIQHYNPGFNSTGLKLHLNLLEEKREDARVRTSAYQEKAARYYNKRVKPRSFNTGDWVLRRITTAAKDPTEGKLGPVWEGPFRVIKSNPKGAYQLEDTNGKKLQRPWNAEHLRKYYM
jgi:hypothetical protein